MSALLLKLRSWWDTAEKVQKAVTLGGAAFLILMLAGIFLYAAAPKYSIIYSGIGDIDKNTVVTEIQAMGVPVKYEQAGVVEVPENRIQEVRMHLAGVNKLPKASSYNGIENLDKISLMTTPAVERERLKSSLEGELAKSIESLEGVQSVRVHITLPDSSPFVENKRAATAAVTVMETPGKGLTPSQGRAIASLIANGCPGMDMNGVVVLNQALQTIYNGTEASDNNMIAANRQSLESKAASERQTDIQATLDRVFGPGMTVVTVREELDLDKIRSHTTEETPSTSKPIVKDQTSENMPLGSKGASGLAGAPGNTGAPTGGTGANDPGAKYTSETKSLVQPMKNSDTNVDHASGGLKAMAINVVANDSVKEGNNVLSTPEGQQKLKDILKGDVAAYQARDKVSFPDPTVTFVTFDTSAKAKIVDAEKAAASTQRVQQIISMLPIFALVLVALVVTKQVSKMGKAKKDSMISDYALVSMSDPSTEEGGGANDATGALHEHPEQSPALSALQQNQAYALTDIVVDPIPDKVSVPLEQIKKMAKERPEAVATLIKSMLLEDRR